MANKDAAGRPMRQGKNGRKGGKKGGKKANPCKPMKKGY